MRLALLLGLCSTSAQGFTAVPVAAGRRSRTISRPFPQVLSTSASPSPSLSMLPSSLLPSELLSDSELVQAEVMNGMTHALLDFTTLFGGATVAIRLTSVIGRLFVVAQDVVPGRDILPGELVFQLFLLAVSCHALASASLPKIQAQMAGLMTSQDRQAFRSLFRPAGISWSQYKELHLCSMDWVTVEPGHVILTEEADSSGDDAVYWLYSGVVHMESQGAILHNISSLKQQDCGRNMPAGLRLLGEKRLAHLLNSRRLNFSKESTTGTSITSASRNVTAVAGDSGATLLRMNTTKLQKHLQHDPDLTSLISRLAFQGMQDKLDALLLREATSTLN
jgi:hypothetical protein